MTKFRQLASVSCHVALVRRKGAGENVASVVVADEIERVAGSRVERGADRALARRADRPGRQAGLAIGVIRRSQGQLALSDGAGGLVVQAGRINHRRVALKRHPRFQASRKHSRNQRPFVGVGSLLLDHRGEGDSLVQPGGRLL